MAEKLTRTERIQKVLDEAKANPPSDEQRRKNKRTNWIVLLVLFSFIAYGCVDLVTDSDDEIAAREAQELAEQAEKAEKERIKAEEERIKAENERIQAEEIDSFETEMEGILQDNGYTADIYIDPTGLACCYIYSSMSYYEVESITKGMVKGIRNMETVNGHTVYI
ncbi:hypothetical protein [Methanococcoides burtonii]|uniref:Uncharacterized protein n=1 Tax=Methanococcoides burtonii (strain DSM 6242 / NBRC 107633 / OCM 468 / ACE-M) TaxID=259564 RepID=Q12YE5_METBU|nr:hypothetical protein [Methanococcoides burtonii]ABE51531.1 Hypothetical protein Mbur_0556 [Methanococcoides burtonii DSM 6242]